MLKLFSFLLLLSFFVLSCDDPQENINTEEEKQDTTQKDNEELITRFNSLSMTAKIDYFNSLRTKDKFKILDDYLSGKCFELPIDDVIKFQADGFIQVDWMIYNPAGAGLLYASGDKEPFIDYSPFRWEIKNKSLLICKTEQWHKYENLRGEENLIFNFNDKNDIVYDHVSVSIFQKKLYLTIKNNQEELSFLEGSCEVWPVMNEQK